jgi:hypothetical protein
MAFSLGRMGNQASIPSFADLIRVMGGANPSIAKLSGAGTTDTLTAAQMAAGIFVRSGATAAVAVTTDTASNILTALGSGVYAGMTFMLIYVNLNTSSGAVTVSGGTGVTTSGTMTIPVAGLRVFIGTVTNVSTPAVTLQGAFQLDSGVSA